MNQYVRNLGFFLRGRSMPSKFQNQVGPRITDFSEWYRSLFEIDQPIHLKKPWLSPMANRCLKKLISYHCDSIFEYGAGSSTLFAMKHVREVHGVEHSMDWHSNVRKSIELNLEQKWNGVCVEPEEGGSRQYEGFQSSVAEYRGLNFRRYVQSIDEFADKYFDVSVVDGRARPACLLAALPKTKNILVLDNSERDHYRDALASVSKRAVLHVYGPSLYTKFFSTTSFISVSDLGDQIIDDIRQAC